MSLINSAGLVIVKNNKILLAHPTRAAWIGTFSIPKGKVEDGETLLEAAIRETKEEVGITFSESEIPTQEPFVVVYKNKNKTYKKVHCFFVDASEKELPEELDKNSLQLEEVDYAKFFSKEEAELKVFYRFLPLLERLK
jgi:8-oxo-dGTP diphosphatase